MLYEVDILGLARPCYFITTHQVLCYGMPYLSF